MRPSPDPRRGLTLSEIVAVCFIVGVLLLMILPALGQGRAAARRSQCLNNLKQLSLALENYQNSYEAYPPGVQNPTGPVRSLREGFHLGWIAPLLPYMEQNRIGIDTSESVYSQANASLAAAAISVLHCPSDPYVAPVGEPVPSTYAACHHDVEAPIDATNMGTFYLNSHTRPADIFDGSSATIFIGEKLGDPSDLGWVSGTRATLRNTGHPINAPAPAPNRTEKGEDDGLYVGGFSSRHQGGGNFAFGDGSVRFVSQTIAPAVFRNLGNRDDGELTPITSAEMGPLPRE